MSADSVYPSFLALLSSNPDSTNPSVPGTTLYPAISHYLSTLPRSSLSAFTSSLVTSPYLWPPSESSSVANLKSIQDAVRASVVVRLSASPRPSVTEGLIGMLWHRRADRPLSLDDWVQLILRAILDDKTGEHDSRVQWDLARLALLAGLYEGVAQAGKAVADSTRREVEVELLVALDGTFIKLDKGKGKQTEKEKTSESSLPLAVHPAFHIASTVFPLVPQRSLKALDLRSISALSIHLLPRTPDTAAPSPDGLDAITIVLAKSLETIAGSRINSAAPLVEEIVGILDAFSARVSPTMAPEIADVYIQSYLLPVSATVIDLFLTHPHLSGPSLCTTLLLVWSRLAQQTASLGGLEGLDGYGRMWWGLLDCWLADGKDPDRVVEGMRRLKAELFSATVSQPEMRNYYLMVAEQVLGVFPMGKLGDEVVQDLVILVCEPHLEDNSNLALFESAHSVMLALLTPPDRRHAASLAAPSPNLLARVAVDYSDILIRAADSAILTDAQLQHALSLLLPLLLSISPALPLSVLYTLHERSKHSGKTLRLFASLLPSVPVALLPRYLVQVEDALFAATEPRSEDREGVVQIIWDGVGGGGQLADEARVAVGRWWEEVRERLKAEERSATGRKQDAKL